MSIRIALDNQPEFYTNLDHVAGRVILGLNRAEQVGNIVVKLEGESVTALQVPNPYELETGGHPPGPLPGPPGSVVGENHKVLYKVQQVFPDEYHASSSSPYGAFALQPGEHEFPFRFKLPINNACSDPEAMSRIGGLGGLHGFASGAGLFGMGGVRVMDGSKQLFLKHVTRTLPPSLTGYPGEAEIKYYIKVTVQRPGFLKENWRFQVGFKFLPIEPPRPAQSGQEAFARRPFAFRPRTPPLPERKRSSFFGRKSDASIGSAADPSSSAPADSPHLPAAPSIEMAGRLPHPAVFTCNQPIPLRLIAKKLVDCHEQVRLISFQMDLIGITEVRSRTLLNKKINRWVVAAHSDLDIALSASPQDEVGNEFTVPDELWKSKPLPNTVAPSFSICNLSRRYELELKLGLAWGKPKSSLLGKGSYSQGQTIFLPLHFSEITVFSGITPPPELVEAARNTQPGRATLQIPPRLPPRASSAPSSSSSQQNQGRPPLPPHPVNDPLYPPQLQPGQTVPPYDDAPPSYDEAMAENLSGPFDGTQPRPAYSGITNENAPSQMPAKS
ncbi:hypothetical protein RJ55_01610 [Drechmeria coniospora]|nr:hypothetical protein RJ55_01610 [Drechmeria coniospora]